MVSKVKRVGLWAAAIFAAGHASGCAFAWLAAARADDVTIVDCSAAGRADYDVGSAEPADLSRLSAVRILGTPAADPVDPNGPKLTAGSIGSFSFSGSVAHAQCTKGDRVAFVLR